MSFSDKDRLAEIAKALCMMLECTGDKVLDAELYLMNEDPYNTVPKTTWRELEQYGYIARCDTIGHPQCRLTGLGWFKSLQASGRISDEQFHDRLQNMVGKLKDTVKGRQEDVYLYTDEVASMCNTSEDFVLNVVESRLIYRHFHMLGPEWEERWKLIRVPINFGFRPLSTEY